MRKVEYSSSDKWNRLTYVSDVPSEFRGNDTMKRRRCLFLCDCGKEHIATFGVVLCVLV